MAFPVTECDLVVGFPGGVTSFESGTGATIRPTAKGGFVCVPALVFLPVPSLLPPASFVRFRFSPPSSSEMAQSPSQL